jgi:hypothetical protein
MDVNDLLDAISRILWRSTLIGIAFLFIWFFAFKLAASAIYQQAAWFGLSVHECDLVMYCSMGFVKVLVLIFFFFPYIAIRLVLRSRRK